MSIASTVASFANFPMAHIISKFILDGKTYEVEYFKIFFSQDIDYKGQPQHEVRGGEIKIKLTHSADNNLYLWAKTAHLRKSGQIIFQTDLGMSVLRLSFENAYCTELTRNIDSQTGTHTILTISPESVKLNELEHDNFWK